MYFRISRAVLSRRVAAETSVNLTVEAHSQDIYILCWRTRNHRCMHVLAFEFVMHVQHVCLE